MEIQEVLRAKNALLPETRAQPVRVYRARIEPEGAPSQLIEEKKPGRKGLSRGVLAVHSGGHDEMS